MATAGSAELDPTTRATVSDLVRERDQAALEYLRSWLRGEPIEERVSAGLTILAREAIIAAMVRDKDRGLPGRVLCLFGRRVTPETLPVVLMECRGVRFHPGAPIEGRTFTIQGGDPKGR
jgi:hypothetical protein